MKKWFHIAKLNLKNYQKLSRSSKITLVVGSILFLVVSSFLIGIKELSENIIQSDYRMQEIVVDTSIPLEDRVIHQIRKIKHVEEVNVHYILYPEEPAIISFDDKVMKGLYFYGAHSSFSAFSKKRVIQSLDDRSSDPIIAGRTFKENDTRSAIIDENYAYIFGYTDLQDIVGKRFSLQINGHVIDDILIIGVFDYRLGHNQLNKLTHIHVSELEGFFSRDENVSPFILSHDIITEFEMSDSIGHPKDIGRRNVNVFVDGINHVEAVSKKIANLTENEIYNDIIYIQTRLQLLEGIFVILGWIGAIILIVSLTSIVTTLIIKINRQKKLMEIMKKIGYQNSDITMIYVFENIFLTFKAFIHAMAISLILSVLLDLFLIPAYRPITDLDKYVFLIDFRVTLIYLVVLLVLISSMTYLIKKIQLKG